MIGLTVATYHRLTDPLEPELRAYVTDLLIWTWANRAPLPDHEPTLMRVARCTSRRRWRDAWTVLAGDKGLYRKSENGYVCDAQIEAQQVRALKSTAGKASAAARQQRVEQGVQLHIEHPGRGRPVENSVQNPLSPVENRTSPVENGPPVPPLTSVRTVRTQDQVKSVDPGAGAPFFLPEGTYTVGLPREATAALQVMFFVLRSQNRPIDHGEFNELCYATLGHHAFPEEPQDGSRAGVLPWQDAVLGYAWSPAFWRSRAEFLVTPKTIALAGTLRP